MSSNTDDAFTDDILVTRETYDYPDYSGIDPKDPSANTGISQNPTAPPGGTYPAQINSCIFNRPGDIAAHGASVNTNFQQTYDDIPRGGGSGKLTGSIAGLVTELILCLEEAGDKTGIDPITTSGSPAGGRKNLKSGRHNLGHASDTRLKRNGVTLSLRALGPDGRLIINKNDEGFIYAYTEAFIIAARSRSLEPSVGMSIYYMDGNTYHYDIARSPKYKGKVKLDSNNAAFWPKSSCPEWVKTLLVKHGTNLAGGLNS